MMLHAVATSGTDPLHVATATVAEARSVSTSIRARLLAILEGHVCIGRASLGVGTRERMVEERDGLLWPSCLYTSRSALGYHHRLSNQATKAGRPVWLDAVRCVRLRASRARERVGAAAQLQAWWRALDHTARASVRAELRRQQRGASPSLASSFEQADLRRAAAVWREAPHRADRPRPCQCTTKGLRLERFGYQHSHWPSQERKRKADAGDAALVGKRR